MKTTLHYLVDEKQSTVCFLVLHQDALNLLLTFWAFLQAYPDEHLPRHHIDVPAHCGTSNAERLSRYTSPQWTQVQGLTAHIKHGARRSRLLFFETPSQRRKVSEMSQDSM
jgi:hypothetical protein